jgi:hypothetical protein
LEVFAHGGDPRRIQPAFRHSDGLCRKTLRKFKGTKIEAEIGG